jgi:small subunit ribosomal protein S16
MALSIRLQRNGSNKNPHYRMVVAERTARRDGRYVETLGSYAPRDPVATRYLNLKLDRIDYWVSKGAQLSDTSRTLLLKAKKLATAKA